MPRFEDMNAALRRLAEAALTFAPEDFVSRTLLSAGAEAINASSLSDGYDRVLVVGAAGSGKTTLFADQIARAAQAFLKEPEAAPCPIRVRGADIAQLIRSPDRSVLVHGCQTLTLFELKALLASGRAQLWLDGWDEIPRAVVDHPDVWSLIEASPHIAIATRPPVPPQLENWPQLAIAPLETSEIERLITRLTPDKRFGQQFQTALAKHYDLMDLARSPLLL